MATLYTEPKPYDENSSADEIEALKARVSELQNGIFLFEEVPVQSLFQVELMFRQLDQIRRGHKDWYLIVDLTNTSQPSAEIRARIRKKYIEMQIGPKLITLVIGNNYLIRLAARFVAGRTFKTPFVVVKDITSALAEIEKVRAKEA